MEGIKRLSLPITISPLAIQTIVLAQILNLNGQGGLCLRRGLETHSTLMTLLELPRQMGKVSRLQAIRDRRALFQ